MNANVWLVGAGPSDIGLLTVKGKQVLEQAEVVIYDQLVDRSILLHIPEEAEAINAGKYAGNHILTQEETNALLVEKAKEGKRVVRLKGGDPFVFGRGGEELEELVKEGIPFEVVPGIPSPIAVPAYAGIPVTHRNYTPSFHVVTAHRKRGNTDGIDYKELAALGDVTLIFLMGIGALPTICEGLLAEGVSPEKPAAVIQHGARYNQKKVIATLADLPQKAQEAGIGTPGIILVGDVCALEREFAWSEKRPLGTKRVIVTRPKEKGEELGRLLREQGAEVLEQPVTSIVEIKQAAIMQELKEGTRGYDWLVFTSEAGVNLFFKQLKEVGMDVRSLYNTKIAVIGPATKEALESHGILADIMPESHYGEELSSLLCSQLSNGDKVGMIVPENKKSRCMAAVAAQADELGIVCDAIPLYRTEYTAPRFFDWNKEDIVTFASNSAVKGFVRNLNEEDYKDVQAVCIGKHTLATAKAYGMQAVQSDETTIAGIVKKVIEVYS